MLKFFLLVSEKQTYGLASISLRKSPACFSTSRQILYISFFNYIMRQNFWDLVSRTFGRITYSFEVFFFYYLASWCCNQSTGISPSGVPSSYIFTKWIIFLRTLFLVIIHLFQAIMPRTGRRWLELILKNSGPSPNFCLWHYRCTTGDRKFKQKSNIKVQLYEEVAIFMLSVVAMFEKTSQTFFFVSLIPYLIFFTIPTTGVCVKKA